MRTEMLDRFYEQQSLLWYDSEIKIDLIASCTKSKHIFSTAHLIILRVIFATVTISTREALAGRTSMDVVDLSHRCVAIMALDRLSEKCLHILCVNLYIGSRLISLERCRRHRVIIDNPFHVEVFL